MSRGSAMGVAALRPRSLSRASTALGMEPGGGARRLCRSLAGIARGFGWTMGRSDAFRGSSMAAAAPASGRGAAGARPRGAVGRRARLHWMCTNSYNCGGERGLECEGRGRGTKSVSLRGRGERGERFKRACKRQLAGRGGGRWDRSGDEGADEDESNGRNGVRQRRRTTCDVGGGGQDGGGRRRRRAA